MQEPLQPRRRSVLRSLAQGSLAAQLALPWMTLARAQTLAPTPACGAPAKATVAQTEGPYFKRSSPQRASLLQDGLTGERLTLSGQVLGTDCNPVAGALLDFWQADADGAYDNAGMRLRGHQFTDAQGGYRLVTVWPGLYPGRTRHIHVKVQAPGGPVLTTQIYFPGEDANRGDGIFSPALLVSIARDRDGAQAGFNFVLRRVG